MKTAIYIRVSTDKQEEKQQLPACMEFCKSHGLENATLIEENISAYKNPERAALEGLKQYDHVVVWAFDRIARNRKKFIELVQEFNANGTKLHSVQEQWLEELHKIPEPWNHIITDMLLNIVGWMAEEESKRKGERVKKSVVRKGNNTLSYKGKKWGRKKKQIDMERLISCRKAGSLRKIAQRYNSGLPKKLQISYVQVKRLLQNTPGNSVREKVNKKGVKKRTD